MIGSLIFLLIVLIGCIASFFLMYYRILNIPWLRYVPIMAITFIFFMYAFKILLFSYRPEVLKIFDVVIVFILLPVWLMTLIETVIQDLKEEKYGLILYAKKIFVKMNSFLHRTKYTKMFLYKMKQWKLTLININLTSFINENNIKGKT